MEASQETKADVLKVFAGGLVGAFVGGCILFFWSGFSGDYVIMTTVIISLAVATGVGVGYSIRKHESTARK